MAEIIAIVNQKGGVGKTTTAINVSACLAAGGWKTLLIDADQQGNSTSGLGISRNNLRATFYNFLMADLPLNEIVMETAVPDLYILPANSDLLGLDQELQGLEKKETRLRRRLDEELAEPDQAGYKFVIIDSPPNLDLLTINIMAAANLLIIPTQPEYLSLEGLANLIETYKRIRETLNPQLSILGVLITMYLANSNLSREVSQDLRQFMHGLVFDTVIPRNVRLAEAPGHSMPIILYDNRSAGAQSYQAVTSEILTRLKLNKTVDSDAREKKPPGAGHE